MRLDDQAVSTGSDGCAGQRLHHITAACCVGRVDDDRQVAEHLNQRNSGDIQIIADQLLKGTDAALTQNNIGIAACENVLGSHEELLHGGGQTALEEDRLVRAAQLLEQHEVLHIAGAKLDDIYICEQVEMLFAHDLGDDRQTGLTLCLEQQLETLGLQTLERVRGGTRLECTAAQEGGAGSLNALGTLDDLRLALNRARTCHNIEVAGADLAARNLDDRVLGVEFAIDGLERLGHALYTLDHVIRHNVPFIEPGRVAHQAEDKCIRTLGIVDPQPHIREMLHQFFDMFLVAVSFEYNDHFSSLLHNVINFK